MEKADNKQLAIVAKKMGLQENKIQDLLSNFTNDFNNAKELTDGALKIVVTSESQTKTMSKARGIRIALKNIRANTERTRKRLKEQSLREGRAIDGLANVIKALIIPIEEHLKEQEKFLELKEEKRLRDRNEDRRNKLVLYVGEGNMSFYNLEHMTDEAFENLLATSKTSHEAKVEAEKKAEADKLAQEEKDLEERKKIRLENEQLKKEAEEKEKKLEIERKANEAKLEAEQKKNEAKLKVEQKKREETEAKLEAEKETQRKKERDERMAKEAKIKAEAEAKQKALLAPDKVKLIEFAGLIEKVTAPHVASREAGLIVNEAVKRLSEISGFVSEKAKTL